MHWLQTVDLELFRFINSTLSNPVLDQVMPFLSGNHFFVPVLTLLAILLVWKGGARGLICVILLILVVWLGDSYICNTIKHALQRPRPFLTLSALVAINALPARSAWGRRHRERRHPGRREVRDGAGKDAGAPSRAFRAR